jgi:hypothetical protein
MLSGNRLMLSGKRLMAIGKRLAGACVWCFPGSLG